LVGATEGKVENKREAALKKENKKDKKDKKPGGTSALEVIFPPSAVLIILAFSSS